METLSSVNAPSIHPDVVPFTDQQEVPGSALRSGHESFRSLVAARRRARAAAQAPEAEEDGTLQLRALNIDNHVDAVRLVNLFQSHYLTDHPFKRVYQTDFWSTSMQTRFDYHGIVSMVAVKGEEFVAHLAYDCNPASGAVQLLLPAVHPSHRTRIFPLIRSFWRRLEQTAQRQNWRMVFTYNLTSQPLLQLLAAKCFHCETAALLPCPACCREADSANGDTFRCSSVLVMCNVLQHNAASRQVLYPPEKHAAIIKEILDSLQLPRSFGRDDGENQLYAHDQLDLFPDHMTAEKPAKLFGVQTLKSLGIYMVQINPEGLAEPEKAWELIDRLGHAPKTKNKTLVVRVAMDDSRCPLFCRDLEERGFRFCGVFPMIDGHDYVAYSQFDNARIKRLTLYTERSKSLREYMLSQA